MLRRLIEIIVMGQLASLIALADARRDFSVDVNGEFRARWEQIAHGSFGTEPRDSDGYLLSRLLLQFTTGIPAVIVSAQLGAMTENGRNGGPRPTDEDRAELAQGFVEFSPLRQESGPHLRMGRQEMIFGSSRLIGARDGPNVRQGFDAARGWMFFDGWRLDAFAARPVVTRPGEFDDRSDSARRIDGLYAVAPPSKLWGPSRADLYFLDYENQHARFARGSGEERRQMIGVRFWGINEGWEWNWETGWQFGRFAGGPIRAWALAAETAYAWKRQRLLPRAGLRFNLISGDRGGRSLGTFNAFFPSPFFFGETKVVGPANIRDVIGSLETTPGKTARLTLVAGSFWRDSLRDGVYTYAGALLRPAGATTARHIGAEVSSRLDWQLTTKWTVSFAAAFFCVGRYLRDVRGEDMRYFSVTSSYKFSKS